MDQKRSKITARQTTDNVGDLRTIKFEGENQMARITCREN